MIGELVNIKTADGMRLNGILHAPANNSAPHDAIDAVVCLHGVSSNFYASALLEHIATSFVDHGIAALRVNTRGHDSIVLTKNDRGPCRQGSAYETVDQCRYDIRAWIDFLQERNFRKVAVLGHSLGAIKALYSQAAEPHESVRCVIAASPPRLSYAAFRVGEGSADFFTSVREAEEWLKADQPERLIQVKFPFPMLITAAGYIDKYGPNERYNLLNFVDQLKIPTLFVFGKLELERGGIAFAGLPEAIQRKIKPEQRIAIQTVAGGDHLYTGVYNPLFEQIQAWLSHLR